jgi:hypothetical protein
MRKLKMWAREIGRSKIVRTLLLVIWAGLVSWALWRAIQAENSSSWTQVVIDLIGLPIIIYGLWALRREPEISVGIVKGHPSRFEIRRNRSLPKEIEISIQEGFTLVIRNVGNSAAESVRWIFEYDPCGGDLALNARDIPDPSREPGEIIFPPMYTQGNYQLNVYSRDEETCKIWVKDHKRSKAKLSLPLRVSCNCRVVANGVNDPIEQKLAIHLTD